MKKFSFLFIALFFIFFPVLIFRNYVFRHKVPFPGNLLVSFYQPWASYPKLGYPLGPHTKPIGFDTLRSFYPTRALVVDSIKKGRWPLWNPYSFSGNTLLGVYQSAVFFPLGFLFFVLPQIHAWSLIIMVTPVFTGLFTYLFLRQLGLRTRSSFFGAITYAFSGMMIVWWQEMFMATYSMLFLPLILLAIDKLFKKITSGALMLLVGSLVASIVSGWFQATLYLMVASCAFTLFRFWQDRQRGLRSLIVVGTGYLLAFFISAVHSVPGLEAYLLSSRPTSDARGTFDQSLAPLAWLATLIAPDYFGNPGTYNYFGGGFFHERVIWIGIPALVFLLYELFHWRKQSAVVRFFSVLGIGAFSLGFNLPTSWFILYSLHIPFLSEMTPSRIFFLSSFCFAVVSAFGMERFWVSRNKHILVLVFLTVTCLFVAAWIWALYFSMAKNLHSNIPLRNIVIPSALFVLTGGVLLLFARIKRHATVAYGILVGIALVGVLYFTQKYLYFGEPQFVFPPSPVIKELQNIQGIDRFTSIGEGHIMRNFANYYRLFSPEGYESFNSKRYGELVFSSFEKGRFPREIQRADAVLPPAKTLGELNADPHRKRLMSLLGIRYIAVLLRDVTSSKPLLQQGFKRLWGDGTYDVYENADAIPRFFLAERYLVKRTDQEILDVLYDAKIDIRSTVVLEEDPHILMPTNGTRAVRLTSYDPETVRFSTDTQAPALLFLSDAYYSGWKAYVDGSQTKIYRADYAFRAVIVPAGSHTVTFVYQPVSFTIGAYITIGGIASCIIVIFFIRKRSTSL